MPMSPTMTPSPRASRAIEALASALRCAASDITHAVRLEGGQSNFTYRLTVASGPVRECVVRLYGTGTALLTDRAQERRVLHLLHAHGLGGCLATFEGGHVAEFLPGRALSRREMSDLPMSGRVAAALARLHVVPVPADDIGLQAPTFVVLRRWLEAARAAVRVSESGLLDAVAARAQALEEAVEECSARSDNERLRWAFGLRALCHNDATEGNVLVDEASGTVHLIDWEYAGVNAVASDLGNHFCQLMAAPGFSPESYPPLSVRKAFVDAYLCARARRNEEAKGPAPVTASDVVTSAGDAAALLAAADAYSLASHLQWAAWCAVQGELSQGIDYDFAGCAHNLLACHDARRHEAFPI
jgi:ethanolamine kinase